ncbi:Tetratricopeptide repeat protein OS=Streptomyces fumanus OX=67302 GN=GCM10018772_45100 PE=4 SV=1 [Streptomyces fumanus]
MVARLIDEDPEAAYAYSKVALRLASRVAAVREAGGFAAYANKYGEALAEFRAARRMTGNVDLWPVMADCERGLGRPAKALAMAGAPEVQKLDKAGQVEMRLVAARGPAGHGAARRGDRDAAGPRAGLPAPSSRGPPRLRYAYADALLGGGARRARRGSGSARPWRPTGTAATDASDRLAALDGVEFVDALGEDEDEHGDEIGDDQGEDGGAASAERGEG